MKIAKLLLLSILLLIVGCFSQEKEISLSEFKAKLSNEKNVTIVMDVTNAPNSKPVFDCSIALTFTLASAGKELSIFSYENDTCIYKDSSTNKTIETTTKNCNELISNKLTFYVRYNNSINKTSLFERRAVTEGDNGFLDDCAITRIIK